MPSSDTYIIKKNIMMNLDNLNGISGSHVVAMPYPGRGHIQPMMSVCMLLAAKDIAISFIVTEEWLGLIGSSPNSSNIRLHSIPNVIPSEVNRGTDYNRFLEEVSTKMEGPFDQLLDQLEPPVTCIIADTCLPWAILVGNRWNIPVALLWTQAPLVFSLYYHSEILAKHGHLPVKNFKERREELIDYIPGVPSIRVADLPSFCIEGAESILNWVLEAFSCVVKAQCVLFTSFYELQPHITDTLRTKLPIPIYPIGPSIPYMSLSKTINANDVDYYNWLDSQPKSSVLYVSLGSYLPVSSEQTYEIAMGLRASRVRYMWITRGEGLHMKEAYSDMGLVVPWCDQLRVLSHSSVGGFLTHCGWNSTLEGVFVGVPMLTFPLFLDQILNSKFIVEDWKAGLNVKSVVGEDSLVGRDEIARVVQRVMNLDGNESIELRRRAKEFQEVCQNAVKKGGSSETNLHAFVRDVIQGHCNHVSR